MSKGDPGGTPPVSPVSPANRVQPIDFGAPPIRARGGEAVPAWAKGQRSRVTDWSPGDTPPARPDGGRAERADPARPERHERPDRAASPERGERGDRHEPSRADRHEPSRAQDPARPEPARADRSERPERPERPEPRADRADARAAGARDPGEAPDEGDGGGEEDIGGELAAGVIVISEAELAQREAEVAEAAMAPFRDAVGRFDRVVSELEQRLREDIVDLSARIASALAQRELKLDRTLILDIARRALRLLGPLERVIVKCAESDAELLREHMPTLARAEAGRPVEVIVRPSDDILPGGLLLTFDGGVVDAREERRLQRIVDAVKAAIQELENQYEPDAGNGGRGEGGAG